MNFSKIAVSAVQKLAFSGKARDFQAPEAARFDYAPQTVGEYFSAGFGKCVMLPEDIHTNKYYIAGYHENNPAKGVIDPQYAHAFWLDDNSGRGGCLFISLDVVGLLKKDADALKKDLEDFAKQTKCRAITVMCTHNHAGIDTMGIWGKLPFSGKNKKFMEILHRAVQQAAHDAYRDRRAGKLYYGTVKVPDMQEDIRTPVVYSDVLTRLRFVPSDGTREIYFLNFAAHSESLQGCNSLVSADFPCYLRERIRDVNGAETFYAVGAIGGMISMQIENEQLLRKENRLLESTRHIGYKLADYALSVSNERELSPVIHCAVKEFYCVAENPVLTVACRFGLLAADKYFLPDKKQYALKTQISYYEIDDLKFLMLPCELFPELAYGGYLTAEESAEGRPPEINPVPLCRIVGDGDLVIFGLSDDELGYVIPPNDFMLHAQLPYLEKATDRLGRRHYEETNSLGPQTAPAIADAVAELMHTVNAAKNRN